MLALLCVWWTKGCSSSLSQPSLPRCQITVHGGVGTLLLRVQSHDSLRRWPSHTVVCVCVRVCANDLCNQFTVGRAYHLVIGDAAMSDRTFPGRASRHAVVLRRLTLPAATPLQSTAHRTLLSMRRP